MLTDPLYEISDQRFFKARPERQHNVRLVVEAEEREDARDMAGQPFPDDGKPMFAATRLYRRNIQRAYLSVEDDAVEEILQASVDEESCAAMFESLFSLGVKYRLARKFDWERNGSVLH